MYIYIYMYRIYILPLMAYRMPSATYITHDCLGHVVSEEEIQDTWRYVYHLHFLKKAEQTAQKCQRGFVLRQHSPEVGDLVTLSLCQWYGIAVLKCGLHTIYAVRMLY